METPCAVRHVLPQPPPEMAPLVNVPAAVGAADGVESGNDAEQWGELMLEALWVPLALVLQKRCAETRALGRDVHLLGTVGEDATATTAATTPDVGPATPRRRHDMHEASDTRSIRHC